MQYVNKGKKFVSISYTFPKKKLRQGPSLSGILLFIGLYVEFNVYICSVFTNK